MARRRDPRIRAPLQRIVTLCDLNGRAETSRCAKLNQGTVALAIMKARRRSPTLAQLDVRIHQPTRVTPAMAAGVSQNLWSLADVARMVDEWDTARKSI
jgi:hypothetical protein